MLLPMFPPLAADTLQSERDPSLESIIRTLGGKARPDPPFPHRSPSRGAACRSICRSRRRLSASPRLRPKNQTVPYQSAGRRSYGITQAAAEGAAARSGGAVAGEEALGEADEGRGSGRNGA